ncbi:hypothetical protein [uncultured Microbulbifer sp.]|uniref:hypothetical protein n=1 Tax=uncultured Microbulbifer sp. TaxID=348147 RepID=UPI00344F99B9
MFTHSENGWQQQAYLKASNTDEYDYFVNVSLSGNGQTLAVGTSWEDSASTGIDGDQQDNSASASGAVYIY